MIQKQLDRDKTLGPTPADVPLNALPVIELSREDIQRALKLAEQRNNSYSAIDGGVVFGDRNSLTSHQIGLLGELAVAKLYGIDIDSEIYEWGDGGRDHLLCKMELDTKSTATTKIQRPELLVRADKELQADLYIRAHIINWDSSGAHVRLIGCAPREVVEAQKPRCHPGSTENYVVSPEDMSLMPVLQPTGS